ncbi:hypothetical protein E3U55_16075 [Filobacillus milosensis]|uniref:Uncharacterized protein n=1 Tax=Filobacillus milosensis TaxID=94137 RepID=A0A4Y8IBZ2_9BACI|nr:hypothetical protein [Filobacillus milosensis]TFB13489.1 hypothetical protein E3U55_16075 [Filobacillus milosensis]
MRLIVGTMVSFYILIFWIFPIIYRYFPGDGVAESYLHPIYMGMILLAGLVVACTKIVLEKISELNEMKKERTSEE